MRKEVTMTHPTWRIWKSLFLSLVVLGVLAGSALAAVAAKPVNTSPPTISGTPQEDKTLTGDRGTWSNNPTDYNYFWLRCDKTGGSCSTIRRSRTSGSPTAGCSRTDRPRRAKRASLRARWRRSASRSGAFASGRTRCAYVR